MTPIALFPILTSAAISQRQYYNTGFGFKRDIRKQLQRNTYLQSDTFISNTVKSIQLTLRSAGGVVGGGVIAMGDGRVALRAAAYETSKTE